MANLERVNNTVYPFSGHWRLINTALKFPNGPYRTSSKEPDFFFMIRGRLLPTTFRTPSLLRCQPRGFIYQWTNFDVSGGETFH